MADRLLPSATGSTPTVTTPFGGTSKVAWRFRRARRLCILLARYSLASVMHSGAIVAPCDVVGGEWRWQVRSKDALWFGSNSPLSNSVWSRNTLLAFPRNKAQFIQERVCFAPQKFWQKFLDAPFKAYIWSNKHRID
jgi:hypothetical protein